jgi:hypothetical protein
MPRISKQKKEEYSRICRKKNKQINTRKKSLLEIKELLEEHPNLKAHLKRRLKK